MESDCNQYGGIAHKGVERSGVLFPDEVFTMQLFQKRPAFGVMDSWGNYGIDPAMSSVSLDYDTWYLAIGYWTETEVGLRFYNIETGDLIDESTASLRISGDEYIQVVDSGADLIVGAQVPVEGWSSYSFKGGIDELMFFNYPMSESTMDQLAGVLTQAYNS
jgi:hypothetical protein